MELHRLAYQLVGAYQYVYLTGLKVGKHGLCLLRTARPREVVDPYGKVFQPLAERLVVLVGQHRGGHKHGHLL